MSCEGLAAAIEAVKSTIEVHRQAFSGNEPQTKTSLIEPILKALGWDVYDLGLVKLEFKADFYGIKSKERVDYALLEDDEPIIVIEAKHAASSLSDRNDGSQLFRYLQNTSAQVGILTNGIRYAFYRDPNEVNVTEFTPIYTLDITRASSVDLEVLGAFCRHDFDINAAIELIEGTFYRDRIVERLRSACLNADQSFTAWMMGEVGSGTEGVINEQRFAQLIREALRDFSTTSRKITLVREMPVPVEDTDKVPTVVPTAPSVSSPPTGEGWTRLTDIQPYSKMPCPPMVSLPNGKKAEVPRLEWKQVFVIVAEFLVGIDVLTAEKCPITPLATFGVHAESYHPYATRQLSNGLYWRCFGGAPAVVRAVKRLMDVLGQDPSQVWLKTG